MNAEFLQQVEKEPRSDSFQVIVVKFADGTDSLIMARTPIDDGFYIDRQSDDKLIATLMSSACSYGTVAGEVYAKSGDQKQLSMSPEYDVSIFEVPSAVALGMSIIPQLEQKFAEGNISFDDHLLVRLQHLLSLNGEE